MIIATYEGIGNRTWNPSSIVDRFFVDVGRCCDLAILAVLRVIHPRKKSFWFGLYIAAWIHLFSFRFSRFAVTRKTLRSLWLQTWKDLPQRRIQEWIERIPQDIKDVIRLEGGNEYSEGRAKKRSGHVLVNVSRESSQKRAVFEAIDETNRAESDNRNSLNIINEGIEAVWEKEDNGVQADLQALRRAFWQEDSLEAELTAYRDVIFPK